MLNPYFRLIVPLVACAAIVATPSAAFEKNLSARPALIQELYACRDIAESAARLACFDREVAELSAAETKREISFADTETMKKTRRGLFGFALPQIGLFGGDDEAEKVNSIETTVASASADGQGRQRIEMADGSIWVQTDDKIMPLRPRPGQKILIKSAALGTYFLSLEGRPSVRVRRER